MCRFPIAIAFASVTFQSLVVLIPGHAQDSTGSTTVQTPEGKQPEPHQPMPTDPSMILSAEPTAGNWQLDFRPGELRLYNDPATSVSYWYFTYKVINRTGQDRWWGPKFELLDESGKIQRSGRNVPVIITKRIEALVGNPLIEDQYQVLGEIRQGESNAKEGFVVWPAGDAQSVEFSLFVRGMSSELRKVPDSTDGTEKILHKTMKIDFRVPGDAKQRGSEPAMQEQVEWILR